MGKVYSMIRYNIDTLIFEEIIPEMFRRVGKGENCVKEVCSQHDWFMKETWTPEEEKSFKDWLVVTLRTKLKMTKKLAEREAGMFLLNWGWATGEEKQMELGI